MAEPFIGEIRVFGGNFAPRGWAFCNGEIMQISDNQALYAILGTMYGGDGRSTFALPDLRGRVAIGAGHSPTIYGNYTQGLIGGLELITLTEEQLPPHQHTINSSDSTGGDLKVTAGAGNTTDPSSAQSMASAVGFNGILSTSDSEDVIENCVTGAVPKATDIAGQSQPISNMQPYTVLNYIIATTGLFPSRN